MLLSQKPNQEGIIKSAKNRIEELNKLRSIQEGRLSEILTNSVINRNPIQLRLIQEQTAEIIQQTESNIRDENIRISRATDELVKIDNKINDIKLGSIDKKDIQTFKFVADALGMSLDSVAKWFMIMIIVVFDPLAICLILAYNVSVYRKEDDSVHDNIITEIKEKISQKNDIILPQIPNVIEKKVEESLPLTSENVTVAPPVAELPTQPYTDAFAKGYFK